MNEIYSKHRDEGLIVVGVSDESGSKLEKFIEDYKVEFPIISSSDANRVYGIKGYPTFALIGAGGELLADLGHGKPSEDAIKSGLGDVTLLPDMPKSSKLGGVKKAFDKKQFAKVANELKKLAAAELNQAESTYVDAIRGMYESRIAGAQKTVKAAANGPDYYEASKKLKKISKAFKGLPVAGEADAELGRFKRDKSIKKALSAGKKLDGILGKYDASKRGDRKKLRDALAKFASKHSGTIAGDRAKSKLDSLPKR